MRSVIFFVAVILALGGSSASGADLELQAEFISRLPHYISWPADRFESDDAPIIVGILGEDPYGSTMRDALEGATAQGRGFEIRHVENIEDASTVHVLVVSETSKTRLRKIARSLKGLPVVTIAPSFSFPEAGGIVGMEIFGDKVAFEINNKSAKKSNLKFRSRVLKLATTVY